MDALRSPPPSAASFTFPPSQHASTSSPSSQRHRLAAAFDYPVRQESLAHHSQHHPSASISTASSSSSRGRGRGHGHAYFSSSTSSSSAETRSAYTSCTSDAFEEDGPDDCDYSDAGSVLDELYDELASFHPLADDADSSAPHGCGKTDSTALLRERTRYRSSASYSPTQALNLQQKAHDLLPPGAFGTLSFEQRDSQLSLLASIAASPSTPLDRCFCGNEAEDDSIYCGRACAQADALNALCGGGAVSSGAEEAAASSGSGSSSDVSGGLAGSGEESHYRRVEKEEARRAKERERLARREKKAGRKLGRSEAAARLQGRAQDEQRREEEEEEEEERVVLPPPRTTSRPSRTSSRTGTGTPSLSSSVSSLASSAHLSPVSLCFPSAAAAPSSPFIVEPISGTFEPPLRPCTPNPPHVNKFDRDAHPATDIYSSYLIATPLASDKLRTPTQHPRGTPGSTLVTPRATFPRTPGAEDEEDESPTQRGTGAAEGVGLRMLELCADDEDESGLEERDQVSPNPDEGGWGARDMRERMWARSGSTSARSSSAYGHTKGKLSFEDVVGILGA